MAWIDRLMTRESLPVLEAGMGFSHQKSLVIANNIANVETPNFYRESVPEDQFYTALREGIDAREAERSGRLNLQEPFDVAFEDGGVYPRLRLFNGREYGPERHDENSVVIEYEMAEQAKNTLKMQAMQQLYKKHLTMLRTSLRDRVA
jgi:flagellar basal-body rod protein FlgB